MLWRCLCSLSQAVGVKLACCLRTLLRMADASYDLPSSVALGFMLFVGRPEAAARLLGGLAPMPYQWPSVGVPSYCFYESSHNNIGDPSPDLQGHSCLHDADVSFFSSFAR